MEFREEEMVLKHFGIIMGYVEEEVVCTFMCLNFEVLPFTELRRNPINQGHQLPKSRVSALTTAYPVLGRMGLLVF